MKKIVKIVFIIIVSLFIFTSCGLSKEDKAIAKEYERTSKKYAVDYIKEKYGFTAEAKKAEAQTEGIALFGSTLSGEVIVTMKYDKTKFYVKLNAEKNYEPIGDTYQNPSIQEGIIEKLKDIFGQEPVYFSSALDTKKGSNEEYHLEYYDGTNIEDFYLSFEAAVINYNQEKNDVKRELEEMIVTEQYSSSYIKIYNYKSKKAYEKSKQIDKRSSLIGEYAAIYLKGYYESHSEEIKYQTIDIKDDDIVLVTRDYQNNKIFNTTDYTYEKIEDDDVFEEMFKYFEEKPKIIINAIKVENISIDSIYLKVDKYKKYNDLIAFTYCKDGDNINQNYNGFSKVGDYYYAYFLGSKCEELYFVIADKNK